MQLRKAERKRAKIKLGLFGPAGAGKTYSALKIAHGLCGDWQKIAIICTEKTSNDGQAADLYCHLGDYNVLPLDAPYRPERYIDAIKACEQAGMEVIVIDSISHEWEGPGGLLEESRKMDGNSFTNWDSLGRRHRKLIDTVLLSNSHIISCGRTKTEYVLEENEKGKMVPRKVGTKVITREGFDYEVTLAFDLDQSHYAHCTKDRTDLFANGEPFVPSEETGRLILGWCESGAPPTEEEIRAQRVEELRQLIRKTITEKQMQPAEAFQVMGIDSADGRSPEELEAALEKLRAA